MPPFQRSSVSPVISRALGSLVGSTMSSHWLLKVFSFVLIGRCGYFGFGFTTLGQKARYSSTDTHHTSNDELIKVLKSQSRKLTK